MTSPQSTPSGPAASSGGRRWPIVAGVAALGVIAAVLAVLVLRPSDEAGDASPTPSTLVGSQPHAGPQPGAVEQSAHRPAAGPGQQRGPAGQQQGRQQRHDHGGQHQSRPVEGDADRHPARHGRRPAAGRHDLGPQAERHLRRTGGGRHARRDQRAAAGADRRLRDHRHGRPDRDGRRGGRRGREPARAAGRSPPAPAHGGGPRSTSTAKRRMATCERASTPTTPGPRASRRSCSRSCSGWSIRRPRSTSRSCWTACTRSRPICRSPTCRPSSSSPSGRRTPGSPDQVFNPEDGFILDEGDFGDGRGYILIPDIEKMRRFAQRHLAD